MENNIKIFISWSKDRSLQFSKALRILMEDCIGSESNLEIIMSTDLDLGKPWLDKLREQIAEADRCFICLTPECVNSGWIHFEVGALAYKFSHEKIHPMLFDVAPEDLSGPLGIYQSTNVSRQNMRRLFTDCQILEVDETISDESWQTFQRSLDDIRSLDFANMIDNFNELFNRRTFQESIEDCSNQHWTGRLVGVAKTIAILEAHRENINKYCRPGVNAVFEALENQLIGYLMDLESTLIKNKKFEFDDATGKLAVNEGIALAFNNRLKLINKYRNCLDNSQFSPVLGDSLKFELLDDFEERKSFFIHPCQENIIQGAWPTMGMNMLTLRNSIWSFDRIAYYLVFARAFTNKTQRPLFAEMNTDLICIVSSIENEFEKIVAKADHVSLIPIHYAIKTLLQCLEHQGVLADLEGRAVNQMEKISAHLVTNDDLDKGHQVRNNIEKIMSHLENQPATIPQTMPLTNN